MSHRDHHPQPQPGCFGCKALGIGFQGLRSRDGSDPIQKRPVIADEGTRAGATVGRQDEHWDGRHDATVYAPQLTIETKARES
jgi:hypothetical protein